MRKLSATAALLLLFVRCREKQAIIPPYKPSFDSFEISFHGYIGKNFSLRVDSNKAFIYQYGSDMSMSFGVLPDTLLHYFDSTFNYIKKDRTGLENKISCDDCSCIGILVKKDRDSIMGISCDIRTDHTNAWNLKYRIDSFFEKNPPQFLKGYVFFPTNSLVVEQPKIIKDK